MHHYNLHRPNRPAYKTAPFRRARRRSLPWLVILALAAALLPLPAPTTPTTAAPIRNTQYAISPQNAPPRQEQPAPVWIAPRGGNPFFMIGANYEGPTDRAWLMWEDDKFDIGLI